MSLSKKVIALMVLLLALIMLLVVYCKPKTLPPKPIKVVETEIINPTTIQKTIRLIGTVHPKHTTLLVAKGSGVLDTLLTSGQGVKKGDLIAKLINADIEKNHQLSKDAEEIAKIQYDRFLNLQKKGYVSTRELEEKQQALIQAQKELAKTTIELKNMRFYSPFDGVIGAFKIKEGTQVNEGNAVVTVYDPLSVSIDFDIPCTHLKTVKENQPVKVFNKTYFLSHVQKMMDVESHMCPADVDIVCEHCVIGDSVALQLMIEEKQNALVIPTQALFLKDGKLSIYKVLNNHIERVSVKQGLQEKDKVEIISGLNAQDQVIIKSPERLYPGLEVSIYQPLKTKTAG